MELLPCPFCGSNDLGETYNIYSLEIYCNSCLGSCDSESWNTRASPWISVKYKLPSFDTRVLVCDEKDFYPKIATYLDYSNIEESNQWYIEETGEDNVTHWQPIPEPPKETE